VRASFVGLAVIRPEPYHDEGPLVRALGALLPCHWVLLVSGEMEVISQHAVYMPSVTPGLALVPEGIKNSWCLRKIQQNTELGQLITEN
jgi:hypothetical protein